MRVLRHHSEASVVPAEFHVFPSRSFMRIVHMQAWVFGAFDDEERAPIYYTNAVVYLLPWLSRGFELDRFSIACLVAGVLHVQVPAKS